MSSSLMLIPQIAVWFILLSVCSLHSTATQTFDQTTESMVRSKIRAMIFNDPRESGLAANNYRMLAGLVRLSFHDCVGVRCDGCINMKTEDNAGLDVYINKAEVLYQKLKDGDRPIMSRADFWALAGIEALTAASEFGRPPCRRCPREYPKIKFQMGRKDCVGNPKGSPWTDDVHKFPNPLGTTEETVKFFENQFGFSYMDTVAIMGAHTLGLAHPTASGFANPWVERKNKFDNEYYKAMLNTSFEWKHVKLGRRPRFAKWQWESRTGVRNLMMLNCDMSLLKNLTDVSPNGHVQGCNYDTCKQVDKNVANTAVWVKKYANDNSLFLQKFARAFQKMISHGYTASELRDVESAPAFG